MLSAKPFFGADVDDVWNMELIKTLSPGVQHHKTLAELSADSEAHVG